MLCPSLYKTLMHSRVLGIEYDKHPSIWSSVVTVWIACGFSRIVSSRTQICAIVGNLKMAPLSFSKTYITLTKVKMYICFCDEPIVLPFTQTLGHILYELRNRKTWKMTPIMPRNCTIELVDNQLYLGFIYDRMECRNGLVLESHLKTQFFFKEKWKEKRFDELLSDFDLKAFQ